MTNINWELKIDVKNPNIFDEVEKEYGVEIPENLRTLIIEANAGMPDKNLFYVNGVEKVFGVMLSYNREDYDNIFTALEIMENKRIIPFASDPAGNLICYHNDKKVVVYINHETDEELSTDKSLEEFINSLSC